MLSRRKLVLNEVEQGYSLHSTGSLRVLPLEMKHTKGTHSTTTTSPASHISSVPPSFRRFLAVQTRLAAKLEIVRVKRLTALCQLANEESSAVDTASLLMDLSSQAPRIVPTPPSIPSPPSGSRTPPQSGYDISPESSSPPSLAYVPRLTMPRSSAPIDDDDIFERPVPAMCTLQ